ncbi:MotA/TolQ/ExbB proton channel family protein [Nitrincola iocasae]|nr:MotA/TolQ/ExbB proton channel family protein [Nitrincola iocasae]
METTELPLETSETLATPDMDPLTTQILDPLTTPDLLSAPELLDSTLLPSVAEPAPSQLDTLVNLLDVGGPVVWILCVFSVFALTLILLKFWQLSVTGAGGKRKTLNALTSWNQGKQSLAIEQLNSSRQALPRLIGTAMRGVHQKGDTPQLREELSRLASIEMENLRSFLRPLEVIANLSPLLGLLGTVLGMIVAFQQMELAGNQVDPSVLSGGIWQALLTTAAGLIVAIPVFLAHSTLERKTERIAHDMEILITSVFTRNCLDPYIPGATQQSQKSGEDWKTADGAINAA